MEGDAAHHLGRVLRAQPGQVYELSDGARVRLGRIESVGRDRVEFALMEELPGNEPALKATLLLAVVKFDSFEWAIEKAVELGVSAIVPLAAARSEKGLLAAAQNVRSAGRRLFWRRRSSRGVCACRNCGRDAGEGSVCGGAARGFWGIGDFSVGTCRCGAVEVGVERCEGVGGAFGDWARGWLDG